MGKKFKNSKGVASTDHSNGHDICSSAILISEMGTNSACHGTMPDPSIPKTEEEKVISVSFCANYFSKIFRVPKLFPPNPRKPLKANWQPSIWSFIGAFIGMSGLALVHFLVLVPRWKQLELNLLAFSFAATAVIIYDLPESPLAQPRNVIGGHLISAFIGLTIRQFIWGYPYISGPLAVALSITVMRLTNTTHPPGGPSALMAAISTDIPTGPVAYLALLSPFLAGSLWLVFVAIVVNNFSRARQYPLYWF